MTSALITQRVITRSLQNARSCRLWLTRSFASSRTPSSSSDLPSSLFRLQRPGPRQILKEDTGLGDRDQANGQNQRAHAVALFPGDYQDDPDSPWDDDDEANLSNEDDSHDEIAMMQEALKKRAREEKAKRERWIQNAIPPLYEPKIDERGRSYGRGGRKRASARVWIQPGMGEVVVNRRPFVEYFDRMTDRELVLEPLVATETCGAFDVQIMVQGGGLTGQAGAARHGLARALHHFNPDQYRPPLKRLGLLTRDPRKVERKKVGRVKARKSPQWVRR